MPADGITTAILKVGPTAVLLPAPVALDVTWVGAQPVVVA